jgi:LmbE family N-acetylglucosaminyl deacetylase
MTGQRLVLDQLGEVLRTGDPTRCAGLHVAVLSPHLDDGLLSCGGLVAQIAAHCSVTVVTLFSEACPGPHSRAAQSFVRQAGWADRGAVELFAERRREDLRATAHCGADAVHLGHPDALFRRRSGPVGQRPIRHLAELAYRYPTFHLDIARGRVSRGDQTLLARLAAETGRVLRQLSASVVLCPLGVGRHADHLITRSIGAALELPTYFYADFPYLLTHGLDEGFVRSRRLERLSWDEGQDAKEQVLRLYQTQFDALFPESYPRCRETYYGPPRQDERSTS